MINTSNLKIIDPKDISSKIPANSKNIIFWDTCGILDIMNLVINSTDDSFIKALMKINQKLDNHELVCFSSNIVITEINYNFYEPYGQADKLLIETI